MHYTKPETPVYYIDPKPASVVQLANPLEIIPLSGSEGMKMLKERLQLLK
jgi:NAD-dependent deacetylase